MITGVNFNGFSSNLVCALISWRSGLGLLMGKFRDILTVICLKHAYIFVLTTMSKCQGILTKLGTCINIKEIWFGIACGQISSMFDRIICPQHDNSRVL